MPSLTPPFKADIVGSLLRPQALHEARARRAKGEITEQALRRIESDHIAEAVALHKEVGLKVCTDGEFHRRHWAMDFLERIDGLAYHGALSVKFHDEQGDVEFAPPRLEVRGKLARSKPLSVADFAELKPLADRAGVYLIFGARMQLLYVGKSPTLGTRLSSYFRWSAGKGTPCRVVHTAWKTRPMFVATIAVTESFEAAALEEYLIGRLHPEENYLLLTSPDSSSDSVSFSSWSTIKSSRRTHVTARCFYSQRCLETQVVSRLPRSALGAGFHAKHLDDPNSDQIGFSTSGEFAN